MLKVFYFFISEFYLSELDTMFCYFRHKHKLKFKVCVYVCISVLMVYLANVKPYSI